MRRRTFRLLNIASFILLLFALYLNFIYKADHNEFIPVMNADESATGKDTATGKLTSISPSQQKPEVKLVENNQ
jgi:hypothetical protein